MRTETTRSTVPILYVVISTGISSVVTQLLTIREFLAQFTGNEFVIALILFSWLILGGIGTLLTRVAVPRLLKATLPGLGWISLLLVTLSPLQILAIRGLRDFFFLHGVSIGFYQTFAYIFALIAPYSLILGFALPYSLEVLRSFIPDYPGSRIYITDNFGDVSGGALFSFALVYLVTPLQAAGIAGALLLGAVFFLFRKTRSVQKAGIAGIMGSFLILVTCIMFESRSLQPGQGRLAYYAESRYGRIEMHQDQELYTLFSDGMPVFSSQNLVMAEESIHYPLSQVDHASHILAISATGGMITEIEKYTPETIDYVELDPEITQVLFRFKLLKKIPGLTIINQDGRAYLAHTRKTYDAVIVNLPEPETFQLNRFYTSRFFSLVKQRLTPGGVFSFSMNGYDNYLGQPQQQKLSSLYNTLSEHFSHILLVPGQKIIMIAADKPLDPDIPERLRKKNIATDYVSMYYYGNITTRRIDYLKQLMDPSVPENHDAAPRLMRIMFTQWFAKFSSTPYIFLGGLAILLILYLLTLHLEEFVLFSTGCITMGSEILIIFGFQIYFGYIYQAIGMIITAFLLGLLPGAMLGERLIKHRGRVLMATDIILILLMGGVAAALISGGDRLPMAGYLGMSFAVSLVCGCQFPVALGLKGDETGHAARAFSADLAGAAGGTLLTSTALIPYFGIKGAVIGLISIKMISLILTGGKYAKH